MNHLTLRVKITLKNLSVYTVSIPNKLVVIRKLIYRAFTFEGEDDCEYRILLKRFFAYCRENLQPGKLHCTIFHLKK